MIFVHIVPAGFTISGILKSFVLSFVQFQVIFSEWSCWGNLLNKSLLGDITNSKGIIFTFTRSATTKLKLLKIKQKCLDFVHPYVKFTIQNVVLRVSKRKNFKMFPCGVFFLEFLTKCLWKCPNFTKPPLPWKISGCASVAIWQMKDYKERNNYVLEMFQSHAKMCLKNVPQKLNFVMAKAISKSYTL